TPLLFVLSKRTLRSPGGQLFGMKPKKTRSGKPVETATAAPSRIPEKFVPPEASDPKSGESAKARDQSALASPFSVPPILLEGDESSSAGAPGLGQKYIAGPPPPIRPEQPEVNELPEAYGTGRLFLVPRDPHCLYAHWDLTFGQQERYNEV